MTRARSRLGDRLGAAMLACVVSGALCSLASAQPAPTLTVLTIHQGAQSFPSNPVYDAAIRQALLAHVKQPIQYFAEYLDADPPSFDKDGAALAEYIRAKYQGRRIDVVIAVADAAVRFTVTNRDELFSGAPIVYVGLFQPEDDVRVARGGITGVRPGIAYGKTLEAALTMHPETEHVYAIADAAGLPAGDLARAELSGFAGRVPLTYLAAPTVAQLLDEVRALPPRSLVLYIWSPGYELGNLVYSDAVASMIAQASPVPVYGTSDFYIGAGVVGGVIRRTKDTGTRLGELAARVLNGEHAQDLPIESSPVVPVFDWRQIQRWGINPNTLPAGSQILFKTPTSWELYRSYIVGALVIMIAELALIAGLLTQRARRRRAEATIRAREATLRKNYEQTRHLAGRLLNAQEATRAGIARDLHDGLCQDLVTVTAALSEVKDSSGAIQDPKTQRLLSDIEEQTLQVYNDIRQLSHDLHPPTLRLLGLGSALKAHCREIGRRHGVEIDYSLGAEVGRLDPAVEIALFRIAQEALRNAIVHGSARHLTVSLARPNGHVELTVSDDGRGFDVEAARRTGDGLGLMSMDERAHVFGGDVQVV
ncbi:MAG TPA: ATP-binding protein, partial [Vicinamibacterales bacterium]|nr:ATP-binding protein [Vicinamibacterales bacterium]